MKRTFNCSIRRVLLTLILFLTLTPILISTVVEYLRTAAMLKNFAYHELENTLDQQASFINNWFQERQKHIQHLSISPVFQNQDYQAMQLLLKKVNAIYPEYAGLVFADKNGISRAESSGRAGGNITDRPYYAAAMQGKSYVSEVLRSKISGKPIIIISAPVYDSARNIAGLVFGAVQLTTIDTVLKQLELGRTGQAFLVNREGLMITGSSYLEGLDGRDQHELRANPPGAGFYTILSRQQGIAEYVNYQGHQVVGTYRWLEELNWALVIEQDAAEVYGKQLQSVLSHHITIILVVLILLIPVALLLTSFLTEPILKLNSIAQHIADGRYSTRWTGNYINELGRLGQSLNAIAQNLEWQFENLKEKHYELQTKNKELEYLSLHDTLTGLYNRRYILDFLHKQLRQAERYNEDLSVMLLDIDHFKKVNDKYGHLIGDQVLQQIAAELQKLTRESDSVARYGGEEFLIVVPHTTLEQAKILAERIRLGIAGMQIAEISEPVTISIGLSSYRNLPDRQNAINQLISAADDALYEAKKAGRNTTCSSC